MHTDARSLENAAVLEGDLCIVGAGAAGISMALDWIGSSRRVLLLEGGGFELESEIQDLYRGEIVGRDYYALQAARIHYFGGTTNHWSGWCAPLDPIDFEHRPWVPHSGWPISRSDLDPFYPTAQQLVEVGPEGWRPELWETRKGVSTLPFDEGRVRTKMWRYSPPTRFGPAYRERIVESDNVHLVTHANVAEIVADRTASRVEELTIRMLDGAEHTARADRYVLACGAVQNARLLLASNGQTPDGLGNEHDLVGRYFTEHLEVSTGHLALSEAHPLSMYRMAGANESARGHLALGREAQRERETLNGTASLRPGVPEGTPSSRIEEFPEEASETINFYGDDDSSDEDDEETSGGSTPSLSAHTDYSLYTRIEQAPNPDSRILLDEESDDLGVPRVRLDWQLTELDKHSIRTLQEVIGEEAGRIGLGRVQLREWLRTDEPMWPSFLAGGWHHMGTTRMAEDPERGVVDADCRVHSVENLYVAGSGPYATGGLANPTLTLVALSLRLSDHLKNELSG